MITLERIKENIAALVGIVVLLAIPHVDAYNIVRGDLMDKVFIITLFVIATGDARAALMPLLEWVAARTPTKVDDALLEQLSAKSGI